LDKISLTTVAPVVLVIGGILLNLILLNKGAQPAGAIGGPYFLADVEEIIGADADSVIADNVFEGDFDIADTGEGTAGFVVIEGDSVLNPANPLSTILPTRDGLLTYKVQKGDTLSKIAASFGISLNTIFWANSNIGNNIKPGQEIVILPVSGVIHEVGEDETLDSVADAYGVSQEKILQYNKKAAAGLRGGMNLVIPGAKPKKSLTHLAVSNLPSYPGYFIIPTTGWNWGQLHYYNAIDIANACGTPIYAAAEGLIVREHSYGYNDGYGHYVDIEHPNGVTTRYAHTQKNFASIGDYVLQGDLLGYIGNTGKTHGPTGCHLHFEIRGAKNSFAK